MNKTFRVDYLGVSNSHYVKW